MSALSIINHAYRTISASWPEKDAFAITADIEALVQRMVASAKSLETTVIGKAETPATPAPVAQAGTVSPVAPSAEPDTLYPLPPLPAV